MALPFHLPVLSAFDLRDHLNLCGVDDDEMLYRLIAAAQSKLEAALGYRIGDRYGGEDQEPVPEALVHAVRLLAGHYYENREASIVGVSITEIPFGVADIVADFRGYSFDG